MTPWHYLQSLNEDLLSFVHFVELHFIEKDTMQSLNNHLPLYLSIIRYFRPILSSCPCLRLPPAERRGQSSMRENVRITKGGGDH